MVTGGGLTLRSLLLSSAAAALALAACAAGAQDPSGLGAGTAATHGPGHAGASATAAAAAGGGDGGFGPSAAAAPGSKTGFPSAVLAGVVGALADPLLAVGPWNSNNAAAGTNSSGCAGFGGWGGDSVSAALGALVGVAPDPSTGVVDMGWQGVGLASVLVGVALVVSMWMQLNIEVRLVVAAIRCVLQLTALGYILVPIFHHNSWWVVMLYSAFMLLVAASEAAGRPQYGYKGLFFTTLLGLASASSFVLTYTLLVVIRVDPWYDARYFIPLLGMLLGSSVSGVSVGLATILEELSTGRDRVEILLALGATRMEASAAVLRRSMMVALTPMLNQLSVVGIVSIPGMMTGQILGGSDPSVAGRYQILIMFLVAASTSISVAATLTCTVLLLIDEEHRLRGDKLVDRHGMRTGVSAFINASAQKVVDTIGWTLAQLLAGLKRLFRVARVSRRRTNYQELPGTPRASFEDQRRPGSAAFGDGDGGADGGGGLAGVAGELEADPERGLGHAGVQDRGGDVSEQEEEEEEAGSEGAPLLTGQGGGRN